jgi:polyphenol oxidase
MFKLPSNVQYRIFDKSFKASTGRYVAKDKDFSPSFDLNVIKQNRQAVLDAMGAKEIAILHQVHKTGVYYATSGTEVGNEPDMDASYTDKSGILLAIQTADCVPVLIADKAGSVIGGAHCSRECALHDILENLVTKMKHDGALEFVAIIGPSIQQESYELDYTYFENFLDESVENARFFIPSSKPDHFLFDTPGYVIEKLRILGIEDIHHIKEDTYTNPEKYPSYRRSCHTNEVYKCNMLSTIMMIK